MFASTAYDGDRSQSSGIDQSNMQTILEMPKMIPEKVAKEPALEGDSLLRAQRMSLVQLYLPIDIAKESIAAIGSISCFQFRNLNEDKPLNMLLYAGEMQQLDECERRLALLAKEAESMGLWQIAEISVEEVAAAAASVIHGDDGRTASRRLGLPGTMGGPFSPSTVLPASLQELYDQLLELEKRITQLKSSEEELRERQRELLSRSAVLTEAERLFAEERPHADIDVDSGVHTGSDLLASATGAISSELPNLLGFVGGIIDHSKSDVLQGLLWRALRGHLFMRVIDATTQIDDVSDEASGSDLFLVGANGVAALAKVRRLALSQGAIIVSISDGDAEQRAQEAAQAATGLRELEGVLTSTAATKRSMLVGLTSALPVWRAFVLKERALFSSLNMCQREDDHQRLGSATLAAAAGGCLVAEGWAPTSTIGQLHAALECARVRTAAPVAGLCSELVAVPLDRHNDESQLALTPPTAFVLNKLTGPFQDLINAYGTPTYGEINPGLFILITFPFLFAVMFGDIGHGLIILLASGYLILRERRLERTPLIGGDIWSYIFGGRYIIFMMGLWSVYIGLVYNDCFSRSLAIFGTGWLWPVEEAPGGPVVVPIQTGVPFFGMDSSWVTAQNALIFLNAYKTKQAILLGILQMLFGLVLSALNYSFRGDSHSFYGIFLPQFTFLACTFGYLGILFMAKWVVQTPTSPSLLLTFVDMFLSPGTIDPTRRFYWGQGFVQAVLVIIALLCIPWMLLYRPFALRHDAQKTAKKAPKGGDLPNKDVPLCEFSPEIAIQDPESISKDMLDTHKDVDTAFSFADELVHSSIHTIEFSLASISNTASYLRLWALSLAHSQLSEVLWNLIAEFAASGPIIGVVVFISWFSLTVAILVAMEGLSAFLHALRLHWVEFNNKFFQGEGVPFEPLSLPAVLSRDAIRRFDPDAGE